MLRKKLPSTKKQTFPQDYAHYLDRKDNIHTGTTNSYNLFATSNAEDQAWIIVAKDFLERKAKRL